MHLSFEFKHINTKHSHQQSWRWPAQSRARSQQNATTPTFNQTFCKWAERIISKGSVRLCKLCSCKRFQLCKEGLAHTCIAKWVRHFCNAAHAVHRHLYNKHVFFFHWWQFSRCKMMHSCFYGINHTMWLGPQASDSCPLLGERCITSAEMQDRHFLCT